MDDREVYPVDEAAVEAEGGRLVRGAWCQKMDDDDRYGPRYLPAMMATIAAHREMVCRPVLAFLAPFLFFEVARWEVRRSMVNNLPGATLVFAREDWAYCPFRPLFQDEDLWFLRDQTRAGAVVLLVRSPGSLDSFLAVRHRALGMDRGHTWTHQVDGRSLETYLQDERPLYRTPEQILPDWALSFYRNLREELLASA